MYVASSNVCRACKNRRAGNRKMNSLFVNAADRSQDRGREAREEETGGVRAEVSRVVQDCACVRSMCVRVQQHVRERSVHSSHKLMPHTTKVM